MSRHVAASESLIEFAVGGRTIRGVLHRPDAGGGVALVCMHGGGGYSVGPHRFLIRLGRRLARSGVSVLRFDRRGNGDSDTAEMGSDRLLGAAEEMRAAAAFLQRERPEERLDFLGLCYGCIPLLDGDNQSIFSRYVLLSPDPDDPQQNRLVSLRTRIGARLSNVAGYMNELKKPAQWKRIVRGEIRWYSVGRTIWRGVVRRSRMRRKGTGGGAPSKPAMTDALIVVGTADPYAEEGLSCYGQAIVKGGRTVQGYRLEGADATFSDPQAAERATELTLGHLLR